MPNFVSPGITNVHERYTSRRERIGRDGRWMITTVLECPWESRYRVVDDLFTSGTFSGPSSGYDPTNTATVAYPYLPRAFPDPPSLYGNVGGSNALIGASNIVNMTYDRTTYTTNQNAQRVVPEIALITVEYSRYWDVEDSIEWNTKYLRINPYNLEWAGGVALGDPPSEGFSGDDRQVKPEEAPAMILYSAMYTRHFKGLDNIWLDGIENEVGKVNSGSYTSKQLGITFQPGTLLMLNPRIKPSMNLTKTSGASNPDYMGSGFDVTLRFLYKQAPGHNYFFRPNIKNPNSFKDLDPANRGAGVSPGNPQDGYGYWDRMMVKRGDETPPYGDFWPFPESNKLSTTWLQRTQRQPVLQP